MYRSAREHAEQHRKNFKATVNAEDSRRKREDTANEIRKNKREDAVIKRRNIILSEDAASGSPAILADIQNIPFHAQKIVSVDPTAQFEGTIAIRKILSIEKNPPILEVIKTGVIPPLIQLLQDKTRPKLQFEVAWALTNIASGSSEQTQLIVHYGAVPVFLELLSSNDEELREQAVWALGNIAGDGTKCRDFLLEQGFMNPLLQILSFPNNRQSTQRNATWALSNLCRGKPLPKFNLVSPSLPTLARLLHSPDTEIIVDAAWALSYLSDGTDSNIQAVLNSGVAPRLIELLSNSNHIVQTPALRTIGNIVTGSDQQTQTIIELGGIQALGHLLSSTRKTIRKEACWALSNITAGNKQQTQDVINANLMHQLIHLMSSSEFDVKKEAVWAVSNATTWKIPDQIHHLVSLGVIPSLVELLGVEDAKVILVALDALDNILAVGESFIPKTKNNKNPYCDIIEEADGLDKLDVLQTHPFTEIYDRAIKILENYFHLEAENENPMENQQPNQFFNLSTPPVQGGPFVF